MVSIPEEPPPLDPFHSADPLSRRYNSTSTSPTSTAQLSTPSTPTQPPVRVWTFNDTTAAAGTSKLQSYVDDLVKSDEIKNQKKNNWKRLSVGDRLKKLGKELGRFGRDKDHAVVTLTALGSRQMVVAQSGSAPMPDWRPACETSLSTSPNDLSTLPEARTDDHTSLQLGSQEQFEPEPEATTLATTIHRLIDSLPLNTASIPPEATSPFSTPTLSQPLSPYSLQTPLPTPTDNSPEPQSQPQLKDSRLIALLSNASFMNGSSLKGKPSIWSILENIHRPFSSPNPANSHLDPSTQHNDSEIQSLKPPPVPAASNIYHNQVANESSPSMAFSETSSIMVYSPLFPTQSDFVELAELVPFEAESCETEMQAEEQVVTNPDMGGDPGLDSKVVSGERNVGGDSQEGQGGTVWTLVWPFSIWYGPDQTQRSISQTASLMGVAAAAEQQSADSTTSPQVGTSDPGSPTSPNQKIRSVKSQKSIRAWVPSLSKISVQAFWWGYRLYLPPPILEILSDKTLEAAKRSAVITTALTWFFNNLPVDVFPPPMRPGLILLQRLVPLLGYIGSFISWSWSTIRGYDVGYGVTLTATWILPVALIPGTWYEQDFPKSPSPSSPIPLPRPLSMQSFIPPTPTDHDIPTSLYATPMSSVAFGSPALPPPTAINGENWELDSSLASSSPSWSLYSPPLLPPPLHISSPTHYPTTIPPNSPNSLYFTPTPTPTLQEPLTLNNPSSVPSSPRSRTAHSNSRVGSSSPLINNIPPPIAIYNAIPPPPSPTTPTPTPISIPIAPTPTELPPVPPERPFSPKLINRLLRGPVLQTVPLPDVDDVDGGIGVGVGVSNGLVDRTRSSSLKKKKNAKVESSSRRMKTSLTLNPSRRND
ncbi:hypothetical protein BYT27DRAFT_7174876 [Phlegmacium glaucopus]|nr:hypothetical protein BYT27DRAFT_7174876 [Phlegmacium glaucopus]